MYTSFAFNHADLYILLFSSYVLRKNKILFKIILFIILFLIYFQRYKHYKTKFAKNIFYSPCNGEIKNIIHKENKIIFHISLNLFNNHTQYIPIQSLLINQKYIEGKNVNALDMEKSQYNEKMISTFKYKHGKYIIMQYAGLLARQVYSLLNNNTEYYPGNLLGYIRLSSRVDIILPNKGSLLVKKGDMLDIMQPIIQYESNNE
jgi:phosphatidylserine decarboxylase